MTVDEFKEEFEKELYKIFGQSKLLSPYKTGNLRNNGLQILETPNGWRVTVDLDKAPYAQWLDDKPKVQREHPDGWFNEIALDIINRIMKKYKQD